MVKYLLLVLRANIFVFHRFTRLGINPADVERTVLESTVEVFDVTHDPSHFDTTFNGKLTSCLHFPTSSGTSPRTDFSETGHNDNLLEINKTAKLGKVFQRLGRFQLREVELEVGTRSDIDGLENTFSLDAIDRLEICGVVSCNSATKIALLVQVLTNATSNVSEIWNTIHTTVEISLNRFDLGDAEKKRVHETEDVECHFFRRECTATVAFDVLSDNVGGIHETSATGPSAGTN